MGVCQYCGATTPNKKDGICSGCCNKKAAVHRLYLICQEIKKQTSPTKNSRVQEKEKLFKKANTEDGVIKMSLLEFGEFIDKVWEDSVKDFAKVLIENSEDNYVFIGDIPDLIREVLGIKKK